MAQQVIYTGTVPNDRTGDALRAACVKVNANFAEVYAALQAYLETFGGYTPASFQAASNDLALIVGQGTTMFGRGLLNLSDAAALQSLLSLGTAAAYDVGTAPGNVVRTDPTTGKLPALDGSQLTNVVALSNAVPKATTGQAQAGQDNSAYMTPSTTAAAIQALQVVIALATTAQAQAATDDAAYMTPLKTAQQIAAFLATTAQAQAGTDTSALMTPARTAEAIQALGVGKIPGASAKLASDFSTASANFVDTGLSASITPAKANGRLEILASFQLAATGQGTNQAWQLLRGNTVIASDIFYQPDNTGRPQPYVVALQEVPGSGPQTYTLYVKTNSAAVEARIRAGASITLKDLGA